MVDTPNIGGYNFSGAGESSSGRSHDSGSCSEGSNPSSPAKLGLHEAAKTLSKGFTSSKLAFYRLILSSEALIL